MSTPTEEHVIIIDTDGTVQFIYSDALADLAAEGDAATCRVSDVEPTPDGQWQADMKRVGGPVLGPFTLRGEALQAERTWLEAQLTK